MDFPGLPRLLAGIEPLRQPGKRLILAVAGAPGSGKSTIADAIRDALIARDIRAEALGMDGFHYDDAILNARGWRPRKGAPHTFDVAGFAHLLTRLRDNTEPDIAMPIFDRNLELSRNCARLIPQDIEVLVVEGNYLLLDQPGWRDLAPLYDLTVSLDIPAEVLRERLLARWRHHGMAEEKLPAKIEGNDMPNAMTVINESRPADLVLGLDELTMTAQNA